MKVYLGESTIKASATCQKEQSTGSLVHSCKVWPGSNENLVLKFQFKLCDTTVILATVTETEVNECTVQAKESTASTPSLASLWQLRHCADRYRLIVFHVRQKCVPFTMNICNTLQSNLFYTAHQQTMKMSPLDLKEKRLSINRETNMVIRSMKRTDKGPNETLKADVNV